MSIPLPNLDDRRWSDLVQQGRALIALYSSEWTDHNASDPGITLMELFAAVADMDIYRLNRLTDAHKLALLALLDVRPKPPRPARVAGALRITSGTASIALPAGSQFAGTLIDGTGVLLRSTAPIEVGAASLCALARQGTGVIENLTPAWLRGDSIDLFGADPAPGATFYLGFDAALAPGAWTQLYAGIEGEQAGPAERTRIGAGQPASDPLTHHGARTVWEYLAAGAAWRGLEAVDETRSFSLAGCVRLRPDHPMQPRLLGRIARPCYWVRCRLAHGAFDAAPRAASLVANGVELIQAVPVSSAWPIAIGTVAGASPTPGQPAALRLTFEQGKIVALSVDSAADAPTLLVLAYRAATPFSEGLLVIEGELTGKGSGEPLQRFSLAHQPLVEASLRLFSVEGGAFRTWTQVDGFAASTRVDAHFQLDPTGAQVTLGDGEKGRVLAPGCQLFACYESTRIVPALARLDGLADTPHNRAFLDPASKALIGAGLALSIEAAAAAETLGHAIGRAVQEREARLRAVTVLDFEAIARDTPGLRVARAIARPNLYPGLDCVQAPGMLALIVLPVLPLGRPQPSPGFIQSIAARIEQRRILGTRVVVTGPRYLEVAVHARIRAVDGTARERLGARVARALDAFFDPLTGGPDGDGWPLGRNVYRAEVMQVIDQTPGVDHVLELELLAEACAPTCGNVCLRPTALVYAGVHNIEVA